MLWELCRGLDTRSIPFERRRSVSHGPEFNLLTFRRTIGIY